MQMKAGDVVELHLDDEDVLVELDAYINQEPTTGVYEAGWVAYSLDDERTFYLGESGTIEEEVYYKRGDHENWHTVGHHSLNERPE